MFLPTGPMSEEHISNRIASFKRTMQGRGTFSGKTHSSASKNKMRLATTGVPKSAEHIANMRNRPQDTTTLTCPHCNKKGDYKNMKRWHMDRCKHKSNRLTDKDPKLITCTKCGHTAKQSPNFYRNHNEHCKT
jgi:DNA-directed RNA polymerase subunit RPC12/RpoP